LKKPVETTAFK